MRWFRRLFRKEAVEKQLDAELTRLLDPCATGGKCRSPRRAPSRINFRTA
jgi:hypothetical protein